MQRYTLRYKFLILIRDKRQQRFHKPKAKLDFRLIVAEVRFGFRVSPMYRQLISCLLRESRAGHLYKMHEGIGNPCAQPQLCFPYPSAPPSYCSLLFRLSYHTAG